MSYARLDEGLPEHPKWAPLTDAAFRLGIRSICWARKPERQRRRPGFIPNTMLVNLARRPPAFAGRLAEELINAGKPMYEHGIWEPVDGGWMIHDFHEYGPPTILAPSGPTSKSEAGRIGGQRSAEVRREALGTAQPKQTRPASEADTEATASASAEAPRSTPEASLEAPPKHPVDQPVRSPAEDLLFSDPDPPYPPLEAQPEAGSPRRSRRSPSVALPESLRVSESVASFCRGKGWPDWWVANRFEAFRELAKAKSWRYADWDAALRNYLVNEVGYKRGPADLAHLAPAGGPAGESDAAVRAARAAAVEARVRGATRPTP